jgi:membrane protein YqaA with SNARE-associated domain
MLRRLYDWCVAAASKPYATWLLGIVSFVESSFFPVPPDAMLIPMGLARPDRAFRYATVCTLTSVAGGLLGYLIGAALYDTVGLWLIQLYGYGAKVEAFREAYREWGAWIILLKGMTPIPYKIVTITSGLANYPIIPFILLSIVSRGMRFYLVAFLIYRYGERARSIIEERLGFWVALAGIVLVAGIIAAIYLI